MKSFLLLFLLSMNAALFAQDNGNSSGMENSGKISENIGSGKNYSLGNRKVLSKSVPKYTCNESGKVVVEISVDRTGKTVSAIAGIEGSTTTAKCLLDEARIAAMNTKWQASADAPEKQVGKIVYSFTLN